MVTTSGKRKNAECFLMPLNASYPLIKKGTLLNKSNKEALRSIKKHSAFCRFPDVDVEQIRDILLPGLMNLSFIDMMYYYFSKSYLFVTTENSEDLKHRNGLDRAGAVCHALAFVLSRGAQRAQTFRVNSLQQLFAARACVFCYTCHTDNIRYATTMAP